MRIHIAILTLFFAASTAVAQTYLQSRDSVQFYTRQNKLAKAIPFAERAMMLIGDSLGVRHPYYSEWMQNVSDLYYWRGNLPASLRYANRLDSLLKKEGREGTREYATLCNAMGLSLKTKGELDKSEIRYNQSLQILTRLKLDDTYQFAQSLNNLAVLYQQLGRYRESENLQKKSVELHAKVLGKDHPEYANAVYNLGLLYLLMKQYEKAEPYFRESLRLDAKSLGKENRRYASSLGALGTTYTRWGKLDSAYKYLEQSRAIRERVTGKESRETAEVLFNLGEYYAKKENYSSAIDVNMTSLALARKLLNPVHLNVARTTRNLAIVQTSLAAPEAGASWSEMERTYLTLIDQLFPYQSEREKNQFYSSFREDFYKYFAFLLQSKDPSSVGTILDLQLQTKALLLSAYTRWKNQILESKDLNLIQQFLRWQGMREQIARLRQQNFNQRVYDSLLAQTNELEKQLSARSESFSRMSRKNNTTWRDVQARLKNKEAAIEIIRLPDFDFKKGGTFTGTISYLALITRKESKYPELVVLSNGRDLETRHLKFYRNAIKAHVIDDKSYGAYWAPIQKQLNGVRKVYLSNDGVYNQININTLWDPRKDGFVLDELDLIIVTNTRDLVKPETQDVSNKLVTLVGSPVFYNQQTRPSIQHKDGVSRSMRGGEELDELPGSLEETTRIADKFKSRGWEVKTLLREEATETNLKSGFKPRILHIATHGYFEADTAYSQDVVNPYLKSGLFLSGAGDALKDPHRALYFTSDDGILTAYEVASLNLENSELVVLSACETGLGEIQNGEGVYGLQRSFHHAGANALIMSLWEIDDESAKEEMINFYEYWLSGSSKHEALKKAQQELKAKGVSAYYWGSFILVGM